MPSGVVLLAKPPGVTSFDALAGVKRALGTGKVGHTGTLDRFAQGLLIALVGRAGKLAPWFLDCDKEYEAVLRLGVETDTLDPEGAVVGEGPLPSREALEAALPAFRGSVLQAPPAYSALHVNGRRASALARQGVAVELPPRPVTIYAAELTSWEPPLAGLHVRCSSGTYIRSLARDLARAAGSRAHLAALTRTRIGGFSLADAGEALLPVTPGTFAALGLPSLTVTAEEARRLRHGQAPLTARLPAARGVGLFCDGECVAALARNEGGRWEYRCVF